MPSEREAGVTEDIPAALRERVQWVCWRSEYRGGKWTKVPVQAVNPARLASTTDPSTWGTFTAAREVAAAGGVDGIGYVFAEGDPFAGVDLDGCFDEAGSLDETAALIVGRLDSYTERSPSGRGVHVLIGASVNGGRNRGRLPAGVGFEVYDRGRFFTATGGHLPGTPTTIEGRQAELEQVLELVFPPQPSATAPEPVAPSTLDDRELLERARAARNRAAFDRLYSGDLAGYPSASEADLAFCGMLAFWAGPDPVRIDQLFRGSGLMRAKWDTRRGETTYGAQTIEAALAGRTEVYNPPRAANTEPERSRGDPDDALLLRFPTVDEFVAVDEEGAEALVGDGDAALIPEGGDVMFYGDGGAGKTTLSIHLAFHLAAGDPWLGIPIARPVTVLVIENEGPRPHFRKKLRRKRESWAGSPIGDRIRVLAEPWARLKLDDERWRQALADAIRAQDADVVLLGPVTRSGMNEAGTLQEVRDFTILLAEVRKLAGRTVTFVLVHHENKGGKVSGAWEGAGDTLLHVQAQGHGQTRLYVQKARWSSSHHATTLQLVWADGEGFTVSDEPERDTNTIADELLEAVRANGGASWNKIEENVQGKTSRLAAIRDNLIDSGRLINTGSESRFKLWHSHDPACPVDQPQTVPGGEPVGNRSDSVRGDIERALPVPGSRLIREPEPEPPQSPRADGEAAS